MAIGVAILGGGIFAREEHLPAVLACKDLSLKAIYSRSLKSAKSLSSDESVDLYSDDSGDGKDLATLLQRSDIKAVIIALPIALQAKFVKQALAAGKHVLSEKPIAENIDEAVDLIKWYESEAKPKGVTWSVAENFRYLPSFDAAAKKLQDLGRILHFSVRTYSYNKPGGKYIETSWRKNPTHQGGFLLDGSVHTMAGLRLLLGNEQIKQVSAFSAQLQEHLPPVDTVNGIAQTASGVTGTISMSYGSTLKCHEWAIACEKGSVRFSLGGWKGVVTTLIDGKEDSTTVEDERTGVPAEVRAWAEALSQSKQNERQSPEEALADLELIENILKSGEQNGKMLACSKQGL